MTQYATIISVEEAQEHLDDPRWVFVDCRFSLGDPKQGLREYETSHIAGAVYADLNRDLSGPIVPGKSGRHPLPDEAKLVDTFSRLGIDSIRQVVAYDANSGFMAAARLWWLLRWAGDDAVAVLDGGFRRWVECGGRSASGIEHGEDRIFTPGFKPEMVVDATHVASVLDDARYVILDSRSKDRYRGENETIDPVAGHIPHAIAAPFMENLDAEGRFKSPDELRARFDSLLTKPRATNAIFYCGSGVTAAHNVLAFSHAGKALPQLYAGSWSDWITDPTRPIVKGNDPV